jgi:hypothetical protein
MTTTGDANKLAHQTERTPVLFWFITSRFTVHKLMIYFKLTLYSSAA